MAVDSEKATVYSNIQKKKKEELDKETERFVEEVLEEADKQIKDDPMATSHIEAEEAFLETGSADRD